MDAPRKIASTKDLETLIAGRIAERRSEKRPVLTVSAGTCGQARGSLKVIAALRRALQQEKLSDSVKIRVTGCHGFCEAEPNIIIYPQDIFYQKVPSRRAKDIIGQTVRRQKVLDDLLYFDPQTGRRSSREAEIPFYRKQKRIVLGDNALIDPTEIDDYLSIGGYRALAKVLSGMTPNQVIAQIKKSGLRGRGGAGFLTGLKWEVARGARGSLKYIICNADEGDPGAYMDRSLLEGNPHRVLEGMIIGAYGIGAAEGYVYVRDEYPLAVKHIGLAIAQAEELGLLGDDIVGTGFGFRLRIAKGAGAFVCGEETALIASIEGRVGEPRQRPPFPAQRGLWGRPTTINNVETWGNVPVIIEKGAEWYASIGTDGSKGTKIFSLVGKINNTGLVEVPMGITLREIIFDIGGGIPGEKEFKAVQTGGPSGGCIPKEMIDLPIDYESLSRAGSIMGSGGMIVMDEKTCMVDVAKYFLNFLRDESCGKCISCREGTQRMWEIVKSITEGKGRLEDLALLEELARVAKDASLCGLGQTASNPVLSTLRYFRPEYEAHIVDKKCPALVCQEIVSSPCQYACPISQEASVYIALVAQGRFEEAYQVIAKDNPLPSICGRACSHPCEAVCRAGETGDPIAIRALKRFVTDWAKEKGLRPELSAGPQTRERVAIIGAGPAGLTAAYDLALRGYRPTVFESLPAAGGWLAKGIPDHRLPKDILQRDVENIQRAGVTIKTGVSLGKDITVDGLLADGFKAVFIATGAHKSLRLKIEGEEAQGVVQGTELLKAVNLGGEIKLGARVGVVGGGNAAIDAARVAVRDKNCRKVTILYRRTRKEMPAFAEEIESAIEEGVDIQFLVAPVKVLTKNGKVSGVECIRMELGELDASGRRSPIPVQGSEFTIALDTLIPAIGERPDTSFFSDSDKLSVSPWGAIEVNPSNLRTSREGVFSGGDAVTGPATVIQAMAAGKLAAEMIARYIEGKDLVKEPALTRPSIYVDPVELGEEELAKMKRPKIPRLPRSARKKNFKEVELGLVEAAAVAEARRCLRCELETEDGKKAVGRKA